MFGAFLRDFSPGRLVQVIQAAAVATLVLNASRCGSRRRGDPRRGAMRRRAAARLPPTPGRTYIEGDGTRRRLVAIGLGTMAFGMQDVLLEPYGGQVLGMGVGATTWLTATLAGGGLAGFALASQRPEPRRRPARMAATGAWLGIPAFAAVMLAALDRSRSACSRAACCSSALAPACSATAR